MRSFEADGGHFLQMTEHFKLQRGVPRTRCFLYALLLTLPIYFVRPVGSFFIDDDLIGQKARHSSSVKHDSTILGSFLMDVTHMLGDNNVELHFVCILVGNVCKYLVPVLEIDDKFCILRLQI